MNPKSKPFRFKQFAIYQEQSAMKVGTDGVILGAYTNSQNAKNILDIGCGTALLSLMLAQKSTAKITAIEIDLKATEEAQYNVSISPWPNQIQVLNKNFFQFTKEAKEESFDLIICNPPFFRGKNQQDSRSLARQNSNLPFDELIYGVQKLLTDDGSFYGIFPFIEKDNLFNIFKAKQLFVRKLLLIKGNESAATKRIIVCLKKKAGKIVEESLIIEKARNEYTEECKQLLSPYLLYL